jgi:hypothetical protein
MREVVPTRLALLAVLLLATPAAAAAGNGTATLLVSANVVRSVQVSVSGAGPADAALRVRTSGGGSWSGGIAAARGVPGVGLSACGADPSYVVVTVLADAPFPAAGEARRAR